MLNVLKNGKWKKWAIMCSMGFGLLCLASSVQAAGKMTYVYDSNNRMVSATTSDGITYTYKYDNNGNLVEITKSMPQTIGKSKKNI